MSSRQIFGRDREISEIARRLMGKTQDNVVLVLGERRIGKTTVLNALRNSSEIRRGYLVTYTDMESAGDFADTSVFYTSFLIEPIRKCLIKAGLTPESLDHEFLSLSPHKTFENFMMKVDEQLKKGGRRLLVILDELEKVFEEVERRAELSGTGLPEEVVAALRAVILNTSQVSFVLAGITDVVRRHLGTTKARLFNLALEVELTTLPRPAAAELISEMVKQVYTVTPRAEGKIIDETNCHPYLVQKVCHELYEYMVNSDEVVATEADVERVLDTKILPSEQPFAFFVETIRRPDDMALIDALAFVQSGTRYVSIGDLRTQLLRTGVDCDETRLKARLDDLRNQAPSLLERAPNNAQRYRIAVRLFASHRRLRQLTQHSLVLRPNTSPLGVSA
jgi:AAA+ ATPase superfamily predicted ATPase